MNIRPLLVMPLMLILAGCGTSRILTSTEPQQTIYTLRALQPHPDAAASSDRARVIEIAAPILPPGLDTDRIALLHADGQKLDYYASARWAESFRPLVQSFTHRMASSVLPYVVAVMPEQHLDADYRLQIKINDFQPVYQTSTQSVPTVVANVEFTLIRTQSERIVSSFTLSTQQTPTDNRLDLVVASLEALLQDIQQEAFFKMDGIIRAR